MHEQWRVATIMVKLAIVEPGENWVYEHYWVLIEREWHPNQVATTCVMGNKSTARSKGAKTSFNDSSTGADAPVWDERLKRENYIH